MFGRHGDTGVTNSLADNNNSINKKEALPRQSQRAPNVEATYLKSCKAHCWFKL